MDQAVLAQFLKAGFISDQTLFPTDKGTPQGGLISPILANMTLDGMEKALNTRFPKMRVYFIRYADDFLVITPTKVIAEEAKDIIEGFLTERGLKLSTEKTVITHIDEGFDFLGYNFRKYKKTFLIKPSKKSIQSITGKIRTTVKKAKAWTQDDLIKTLNPIIRGWANYHSHIAAKQTFKELDHYLWIVTWQWGKRRHSNKGHKWIVKKYWQEAGNRNWVFQSEENTLLEFSDVAIRRHVFPKLNANPYIDRKYFLDRKDRMRRQTPGIQTTLSFFAMPPRNG